MMLLGRIIGQHRHWSDSSYISHCVYFFPSYFIMHPHPGSRRALPSTTVGMGEHFSTPKKRRNKKKTQTHVILPGQSAKRQRLLQHLNDLLNDKSCEPPSSPSSAPPPEDGIIEPSLPIDDTPFEQLADEPSHEDVDFSVPGSIAVDRLYENWSMVIPTVIESYLHYLTDTIGKPLSTHDTLLHCC